MPDITQVVARAREMSLPDLFEQLSYGGLLFASVALCAATFERVWTLALLRPKTPQRTAAKGLFGLFAWVAATAPLFGILGTTAGIQQSFQGGDVEPDQVFAGISTALWTTALGLLCAILALSLRQFFHGPTARLWRTVTDA